MSVALTTHARSQAEAKGFTEEAVVLAAEDPDLSYPSRNHPGQVRCIRGDLCAVVDPARALVITVYLHHTVTPIRPDQQGALTHA